MFLEVCYTILSDKAAYIIQKTEVSKIFLKKLLLLFSKDTL